MGGDVGTIEREVGLVAEGEGRGPSGSVRQLPEGRSWTVAALVLAGLGLIMFPIGGLVGVVCGAIGRSRGDRRLGTIAIVAATSNLVGGFVITDRMLRMFRRSGPKSG